MNPSTSRLSVKCARLSSTNIGMTQMIVGIIHMQATVPSTMFLVRDLVRAHQSAAGADSTTVTTAPIPAAIAELSSDWPRLADRQAELNCENTTGCGRPSRLVA